MKNIIKTIAITTICLILVSCSSYTKSNPEHAPLPSTFSLSSNVSRPAVFNTPPVPIRTPKPQYPKIAKSSGVEGLVVLEIEVLSNGDVGGVIVLSSTNDVFEQPAIDAVKKFKFTPAKNNGEPLDVWIHMPIQFSLQN